MKIEVAKSDLDKAVSVVALVPSGKGADLATHFLFRHRDDLTEILAYNGHLGASMPLVCNASVFEDEETAAFTIEAWRLQQWIRAADDAALTLESKDATVTATAPSGSVKFRSLDPSGFPFWDKQLSNAKKTMEIDAKRFEAALKHAKEFVFQGDTSKPEMAVTEIRDGILWSTDQAALSMVTLEEFAKASLRLAGKDIAPVLSFLGNSGDETVTFWEHKKSMFIRREDGAVLTVGRPTTPFLELEDIEDVEDAHWWSVGTDELNRAIQQLVASAAREDFRLNFNFDPADQKILLTMTADSGSPNTLRLACPEFGSTEDVEEGMPTEGWTVEYHYITRVLGSYKGGKTIKFGLNPAGEDGGWTRIVEDRDGDKYLTILVWMPE